MDVLQERGLSGDHVALLRGINVGGKNTLPMADLRALFEARGCTDVRTYIQSGNVVFTGGDPARIAEQIAADIHRTRGLTVPVVLRTADAMARAIAHNPWPDADPKALHIAFLAEHPTAGAVASLDPQRSPGDAFVVDGDTVYLNCPNGVARTKLTCAWFDRQLGTVSTLRNWRTVLKLVDMTR